MNRKVLLFLSLASAHLMLLAVALVRDGSPGDVAMPSLFYIAFVLLAIGHFSNERR